MASKSFLIEDILNKNDENFKSDLILDPSWLVEHLRQVSRVFLQCTKDTNSKLDEQLRKPRRNRTVFTDEQLKNLEHRFMRQKYLSASDRQQLSIQLGLNQLQVKTWYQNRRMKWKKEVMKNGHSLAPTKPKGRPKKEFLSEYDANAGNFCGD